MSWNEVASAIVLILLVACTVALPVALVARARLESHPERERLTLAEQAQRWSGGAE